jgi:effector-binding domain-containing protein
MDDGVLVESAAPRLLAAVRRRVRIGEVGREFKPALDLVWAFLGRYPGLYGGGHNVFLYHHPEGSRFAPMEVDFGVEVTRPFAPDGEVACVSTPGGDAATAVHVGPYHLMRTTHDAIHAWATANGRTIGGFSWEIYGDWAADETRLETQICYLLG